MKLILKIDIEQIIYVKSIYSISIVKHLENHPFPYLHYVNIAQYFLLIMPVHLSAKVIFV